MSAPRILITGSRNWTNRSVIDRALRNAWQQLGERKDAVLVHGAARGADSLAAWIWASKGFPVEAHPAKWDDFGKRAGYIRNKTMVDLGADVCLAFPLGESRGTRNCMDLARKAGIEVRVFTTTADGDQK